MSDHYRHGEIECIDAIQAALKYVWREQHKDPESLKKARWYLDRLIGTMEP